MKTYHKILIIGIVLLSGLALFPFTASSFFEEINWQRYADAYRPYQTAEKVVSLGTTNVYSARLTTLGETLVSGFTNLTLLDLASPLAPVKLQSLESKYINDVITADGYAFTTQQDFGVRVYDLSAGTPTLAGEYRMTGNTYGLAYDEGILYVTNGRNGVWVFDANKPSELVKITVLDTSAAARGITVQGGYAYIADSENGLRIWDVRDLNHAKEIGALDTTGIANGVTLDGQTAYISDSYAGVTIADISDKQAPKRIGGYNPGGYTVRVVVQGDIAYVAARDKGLVITNIQDKTRPTQIANYNSYGGGWDIVVKGETIYLADAPQGISVLGYMPPISATISAQGGALVNPSHPISMAFDKGIFTMDTVITQQPLYPKAVPSSGVYLTRVGPFYEISATGFNSYQVRPLLPYTVSLIYDDTGMTAAQEATLRIYSWNGYEWVYETTSSINTETNTITAHPMTFGIAGVMMHTWSPYGGS